MTTTTVKLADFAATLNTVTYTSSVDGLSNYSVINFEPNTLKANNLVYSNAIYNLTTPVFALANVKYFTSGTNATYIPSTAVRALHVECVGAGGGGGGLAGAVTVGSYGVSGPGGGGLALDIWIFDVANSYTYTIGAAGAGGAGASDGTQGGDTIFSETYGTFSATAGGGANGNSQTVSTGRCFGDISTNRTSSSTGITSKKIVQQIDAVRAIGGASLGTTYLASASYTSLPVSGYCPLFGGGNRSGTTGASGSRPGEGGSGCYDSNTGTNRTGGNGYPGIIRITEYY